MKLNHIWRSGVVCIAAGLLAASALRAEEIVITEFEDGYLSWTNIDPSLYYTVEFKPNLVDEVGWDGVYRGLQDIQSDDDVITVPVSMFWRVIGNAEPQHTQTLSAGSTVLNAGYYEATDLTTIAPSLTSENIRAGASIFGVAGDAGVVDTSSGDAEAEDILAGKKAWVAGDKITGAMPNVGQQNLTPSTTAQTITQGYHDGTGEVTGEENLVADNIRKDVEIFGVTGTFEREPGRAEIPHSGQTTSYRMGDDGYHQLGVAWPIPRFTDHEDGTVTDNMTGLMWVHEPHALDGNSGPEIWNDAIDFCNGLTHAGYSDWRLPNVRELHSLIDYAMRDPALPHAHPFAGIQSESYWSSSTDPGYTDHAWRVNLNHGVVFGALKETDYRVWPVRGGLPPAAPLGMVPIPAGSFEMGDHFDEGLARELPVHTVHISAFHMDQYPVTKALWDEVYEWATHPDRGAMIYSFDDAGSGKAVIHPVHTINWYDMVKWCNARSEMEGRTPAYYTSSDKTLANVYRTGQVDVQNDWVRWDSGYRLPTEAEWEYAARGGLEGKRFPWGDEIYHGRHDLPVPHLANYVANGSAYAYDTSPYTTDTYHEGYSKGVKPYTSPVDTFAPNDFDLYDMAGNVWAWTWDWYSEDEYERGTVADPRGPSHGSSRVVRGGGWRSSALSCRVASRNAYSPAGTHDFIGFRAVLPAQ